MDFLFGITIIGTLLCLMLIEYAVYRIKEEERIKMRLHEVRGYSPVLERRQKKDNLRIYPMNSILLHGALGFCSQMRLL